MNASRPAAAETSATTGAPSFGGKYLTFMLADEEYGLPVLDIREIIKVIGITAVPQVPPYVKGVINLRGKVIPIADLRLKFGFGPREYDERTCIIVVETRSRGDKALMGLVVDAVSEVQTIANEDTEVPPTFGAGVKTDYIRGMAKVKGKVKLLVDLDRIFATDDVLFDLPAA
jgi:purine-binding chemotaxis protein CheW